MQLGDKIKKIRDLKGLKQNEVAAKLNLSPQAYSKIERNETKMDNERLEQLASVLGVTVEDIHKFDDKNLFVSRQVEFESKQNTGLANTVNNYYYGDQIIRQLERSIELQKDIIQQQREEVLFLRKQLETLLTKR